jgi:hypothetical protein
MRRKIPKGPAKMSGSHYQHEKTVQAPANGVVREQAGDQVSTSFTGYPGWNYHTTKGFRRNRT